MPVLYILLFLLQLPIFDPRPLWKQANEVAIIEKATEINTFPCNFSSTSDIDSAIDFLISWMKDVIAQHVPKSKLAPFRIFWSLEEIGNIIEEARRAY
jgi:hypothetical protein